MNNFYITCTVKMKKDLTGIDTYNIKKSVIKKHRNTLCRIRKIREHSISFYGLGDDNELREALWNPEMFEIA